MAPWSRAADCEGAIEVIQAFVTGLGRSCSTDDWLSNTIGAV
jgi:hypothetical protein